MAPELRHERLDPWTRDALPDGRPIEFHDGHDVLRRDRDEQFVCMGGLLGRYALLPDGHADVVGELDEEVPGDRGQDVGSQRGGAQPAVEWLQSLRLSDILQANTDVGQLAENLFFVQIVPEPTSTALLLSGIMLLSCSYRRRRHGR